jgi:ribonuclease HI
LDAVDTEPWSSLFVQRGVATSALRRFRDGLPLLIVGDSQIIIDCLLGDASTDMPDLKRPVRLAHVGLQTLIESFRVKPPRGQQMARQVPRSDNSAADAAANAALDQGPFMEVMLNETATFITELSRPGTDNIGLLFSFDGAARGNPGKSSYGVCAWWGHFNHDGFDPKGLLLWKGARLGTSTNNIAEAHGMASSLKICVRFYCWVIEQTSELAQHSMVQECEFKHGRTGM